MSLPPCVNFKRLSQATVECQERTASPREHGGVGAPALRQGPVQFASMPLGHARGTTLRHRTSVSVRARPLTPYLFDSEQTNDCRFAMLIRADVDSTQAGCTAEKGWEARVNESTMDNLSSATRGSRSARGWFSWVSIWAVSLALAACSGGSGGGNTPPPVLSLSVATQPTGAAPATPFAAQPVVQYRRNTQNNNPDNRT